MTTNYKYVCHITTVFKTFDHYMMVAKFRAYLLVILNALLFHTNLCYRPTKIMTHQFDGETHNYHHLLQCDHSTLIT